MKLGSHMTDEQRARDSASHIGHPSGRKGCHLSEETKAKMSAAMTGRKASPETCAKLSVAHMGRTPVGQTHPQSLETRAKQSVAAMGHPFRGLKHHSLETCAKISALLTGRPKSIEHRAKLSVAGMGRIPSPETRAKDSAALMGHTMSEKTRLALLRANVGEANSQWKGGVTSESELIRHSPQYVAWRTAVFERDNYTCQECGAHSGTGHRLTLEAHHIKPFANYPNERFVVENGKTLCLKCHNKTKRRKAQVIEVIP